jgi:hypothetical protein
MSIIAINPGSDMPDRSEGDGWTSNYEGALAEAQRWLEAMRADGFGADVELVLPGAPLEGCRWRFWFRHTVTGVKRDLDTHGVNNLDAYRRRHIFDPRVYWRGSSCSDPELSDWGAPGYVQTFREASHEERSQ